MPWEGDMFKDVDDFFSLIEIVLLRSAAVTLLVTQVPVGLVEGLSGLACANAGMLCGVP